MMLSIVLLYFTNQIIPHSLYTHLQMSMPVLLFSKLGDFVINFELQVSLISRLIRVEFEMDFERLMPMLPFL